jgi:hypothetical protein
VLRPSCFCLELAFGRTGRRAVKVAPLSAENFRRSGFRSELSGHPFGTAEGMNAVAFEFPGRLAHYVMAVGDRA